MKSSTATPDEEDRSVSVVFDRPSVTYERADLDEFVLVRPGTQQQARWKERRPTRVAHLAAAV